MVTASSKNCQKMAWLLLSWTKNYGMATSLKMEILIWMWCFTKEIIQKLPLFSSVCNFRCFPDYYRLQPLFSQYPLIDSDCFAFQEVAIFCQSSNIHFFQSIMFNVYGTGYTMYILYIIHHTLQCIVKYILYECINPK